jgi:hypothetical protein
MVQVKGYLFTALTVLMFLSLFMLTYYFFAKSYAATAEDISSEKAANLFDDVSDDLAEKMGVGAALNRSGALVLRFDDRIPAAWDVGNATLEYADFIEGILGPEINADLELRTGSLASSTAAVEYEILPVDYAYGYGNLSKRRIWFRNMTTAYKPNSIGLALDFREEGINDIVWSEAENFTAEDGVKTWDADASGGEYMEDFTRLEGTVNIPLSLNYTLWVRAAVDNSSKNFTVEVGGKNSTRFDIREADASSTVFRWYNDTLVAFNMTPGDKTVKVIPEPSSGTESVDVVLLTTKYVSPPDTPPIVRLHDPLEVDNVTGGDMGAEVRVRFRNANYSYATDELSRTGASNWNFTFDDGDSVDIKLGGVIAGRHSFSSMVVALDNSTNGSFGYMNTTASFDPVNGRVYVDSGCDLRLAGRVSRSDRAWLAKG